MINQPPYLCPVFTSKGGSAKTTTTTNVAAGLVARGRSVLVIDRDPQLSFLNTAQKAESQGNPMPFRVLADFPDEEPAETYILVDHPPRVDADNRPLEEAACVIIPVGPGRHDRNSIEQVAELFESFGDRALFFWSRIDNRSPKQKKLTEGTDWPVIRYLAGIFEANELGTTVYSKDPATKSRFKEARNDYDVLVESVIRHVEGQDANTDLVDSKGEQA